MSCSIQQARCTSQLLSQLDEEACCWAWEKEGKKMFMHVNKPSANYHMTGDTWSSACKEEHWIDRCPRATGNTTQPDQGTAEKAWSACSRRGGWFGICLERAYQECQGNVAWYYVYKETYFVCVESTSPNRWPKVRQWRTNEPGQITRDLRFAQECCLCLWAAKSHPRTGKKTLWRYEYQMMAFIALYINHAS